MTGVDSEKNIYLSFHSAFQKLVNNLNLESMSELNDQTKTKFNDHRTKKKYSLFK